MSKTFQPLSLTQQPTEKAADFVVDQLLPRGYLTILAAEPKGGKTAFATSLAIAVATGQPFLGHPTKQGPVLWLSLEENPSERAALFAQMPASMKKLKKIKGMDRGCIPIYTVYDHAPIDTPEGLIHLKEACDQLKPSLIVIDSLHASQSGRSLCDAWAARKTLQGLKRFCGPNAPAVLVLHHLGGPRYRRRVAESAQLATVASMFWLLQETSILPEGREFTLESRGRGAFTNHQLHLKSASPLEYETFIPVEETTAPIGSPMEGLILEALQRNGKLCALEIAEAIGCNPNSARNALCRLIGKNEARLYSIESGTRYYCAIRNINNIAPIDDESDESDDDLYEEEEPEEEEDDEEIGPYPPIDLEAFSWLKPKALPKDGCHIKRSDEELAKINKPTQSIFYSPIRD